MAAILERFLCCYFQTTSHKNSCLKVNKFRDLLLTSDFTLNSELQMFETFFSLINTFQVTLEICDETACRALCKGYVIA